jgi:hypothetical protein
MKQVIQLDTAGYFVGFATADESPLEPGVLLIPGGCIEAPTPAVPDGQRAKWNGEWVFEDIPQPEPEQEPELADPVVARITKLKALLSSSDYKVLPDYDKDSEAIKASRQAWREEIRTLENKH